MRLWIGWGCSEVPSEVLNVLVCATVRWWNASAYYAVTAAEALRLRGHQVTFLAPYATPAFVQAEKRGLRTVGDINPAQKNPLSFLRQLGSLYRLLSEEHFDVVNPHRPEDHFALGLALRRLLDPPILIRTVSDVRTPRNNPFNRTLHTAWTDGMIYCARAIRDRYREALGLQRLPEAVIYSALDIAAYRDGGEEDHPFLAHSEPRIGIVARLSPNKGHRTFLEAAAVVHKEIPRATFLIVGKEEEVKISDLKKYAEDLDIGDSIVFTGYIERPETAVAACDVGVIASTDSEVISRAAQEFMACGKPVIASKVNVLPEMIRHGESGFLFEPGDARQLASFLITLCRDAQLREAMGRRAAELARKFHDLEVFGLMTERFFRSVREFQQRTKCRR